MKRSKFTESQIAFALKQEENGTSIAEMCRKARIAEATFYNWRKRFAGLMPPEMKRLSVPVKVCSGENAALPNFQRGTGNDVLHEQ